MHSNSTESTWKIWIDTGGTFTDCIAKSPSGVLTRVKVLSSGSLRGTVTSSLSRHTVAVDCNWPVYKNILPGYEFSCQANALVSKVVSFDPASKILQLADPVNLPDGVEFEIRSGEEAPVVAIRMVTETRLSDKIPPIELKIGTTKGTNALLENKGAKTILLVTKGFKDLLTIGTQQRPNIFSLKIEKESPLYHSVFEIDERIDANGKVIRSLSKTDIDEIKHTIKQVEPEAIAISFINAYKNGEHEFQLKKGLSKLFSIPIYTSSELSKEPNYLSRTQTTLVHCYLSPILSKYYRNIQGSTELDLFEIMKSSGSLELNTHYRAIDSLLSGPAGGLVAAQHLGDRYYRMKLLTFDMGGTSTDVSRVAGEFYYKQEEQVQRIPIQASSLDIETVAAGGGSICWYDGIRLRVGPHSAGAVPGPACYGGGGPLTVTDVNLLLGRLSPENFSIPISIQASKEALQDLINQIASPMDDQALLMSLLGLINESMAGAFRKISHNRGFDPSDYTILSFGGAAGQHVCELAEQLSMYEVVVPYDAGLLSAFGIGEALITTSEEIFLFSLLENFTTKTLSEIFENLKSSAKTKLWERIGADKAYIVKRSKIKARLSGQQNYLEIDYSNDPEEIQNVFHLQYEEVFGASIKDRVIEIVSIIVEVSEASNPALQLALLNGTTEARPRRSIEIFDNSKWETSPLYEWEDLEEGEYITGPALVINTTSTLYIKSGWKGIVQSDKGFLLQRFQQLSHLHKPKYTQEAELALFIHRFQGIANEMGEVLRRTSFSVNVKDRLDFSCAMLDPQGYLISNAPHIPVHLGSLGICVRKVKEHISIEKGDVIITNHPMFGGSHLPDVTLISAVFDDADHLVGYVANRAHHAEIGGITPGSMPPAATSLEEEGVVIAPTYLIKGHRECWEKIVNIFTNATYPSRALNENLADLQGALAGIVHGRNKLKELCRNFGAKNVLHHMELIYNVSSKASYEALSHSLQSGIDAQVKELLDDGTTISLSISKSDEDKFLFDFNKSSQVHPYNFNATEAILTSCMMYALRLLLPDHIPLNEGILESISIISKNNFLTPQFNADASKCPAVSCGNTEVSQRLTDSILKALNLAACSQGTMNNLVFGNEEFGFYETLAGGTGAGPGFDGADAIHQHMTNTRITDPEIMEFRYPVRINELSVRPDSGGKGKNCGGNGLRKSITFLQDITLSFLSQHRHVAPYGLRGGHEGKKGKQHLILPNGKQVEVKGVDSIQVKANSTFVVETPGGGGYGVRDYLDVK